MIPNHKGEIPVVILLLPFLSGIAWGFNLFPAVDPNWLLGVFILLGVGFICLGLNYGRFKLYKYRWLGGILINIILFVFGWIIVINYSELRSNNHFSKIKAQYLVVRVNNEPVLKNGFLRFTAGVEACVYKDRKSTASGTLLVTLKDTSTQKPGYGTELLIPADYKPVDPPFNPSEFNYKKYLANKNIFYQAVLFPKQFVVLKSNSGNLLLAKSLRLRQQLVEKLKRNMRDTDATAVASTLILGYKADLSGDILEAYSKTGTVYVLTVSGAQVAIIYFLLSYTLRFLERFKYGKLLRAVIIIVVIWYYALLTGCAMAVCRVALMVSMVTIGKAFSRYINTLNILAISAFLLLCYDPYFIAEVGFQLSYLAVFGLLIFKPMVDGWFKFKKQWAAKLWSLCSASIAIQAAIFPLCAFYFHQFPVYFLISNLFVIIPAAVIMYSGIFYLLLPQIPVVSSSIAFILEKAAILMNKGLALIEHSPFSSIDKIWLTIPERLLLFIIIFFLLIFSYAKKLWPLQLSLIALLLLSTSLSVKKIGESQSKNIAWLNLGKHTGIVFRNGYEAIVLSDLKNTDKSYLYAVQPYLDSCGINNAKVFGLNQDINSAWLKKRFSFVKFETASLFIFDGALQNTALSPRLAADYIYITGNRCKELNKINSNFDYRTLVLDGSNSDQTIDDLEKQIRAENIDYKILKRNNSFISISN